MKKTKKAFGAIALSAALALGTVVPAFAAEGEEASAEKPVVGWKDGVADSSGNPQKLSESDATSKTATIKDGASGAAEDGTGSTTPVFIATNVSQIQVAVPVKLVVVAQSAGGALTAPSANAYKIANYSTNAPIYITKVKCGAVDGSGWEFVGAKADGSTKKVGTGVASTASKGTVYLEMDKKLADTETADAKGLTASTDATIPNTLKDTWKILKATSTESGITPEVLPINFSGETSVVNGMNGMNLTPEQVLNITYTVSYTPTAA